MIHFTNVKTGVKASLGRLPNEIILLVYPELDSWESVASLSSVNHRFRGIFQLNKERILSRVYARNYAITHPLGHQDAFRLARYMVTNKLHPTSDRISVSQLSWEEIEQLQKNQKVIRFLQDRFLEVRRAAKTKALNEDLTNNEIDKFCQATVSFEILRSELPPRII